MKKVAITGIGVVSPSGIGKRQFWANIKVSRSFIKKIERFDASRYPSHIAGQIDDLDIYTHVSERLLKKIDVFSHMALIASELALQDARLDITKEDPNLIGIFAGNALGGWLYAETELRDLYLEGREGVSPYLASAWFPAAPQGQISIYYGIKGFSKTVVADRASSLMAIGYAAKTLNKNKLNLILAGGMEAPVTPYALLCCNTYGGLSRNNEHPHEAYRPFDKNRSGFVIGEGSGFLVLESEERANSRNVPVQGFISGFASTCDGVDRIRPDIKGIELAYAIRRALSDANLKPQDLDFICLDAMAMEEWDISEGAALKEVFAENLKNIPLSSPKPMFGNLLGASGALDVIFTLLCMQHGLIPPILNLNDPDPNGLNYVKKESLAKTINKALVISRGRGGINCVLVVEKG